MMRQTGLTFKVASEAREIEQIHRLNYRTFVEEIPQHAPNVAGRLVDKFHAENTYLIALRGARLVGMIAVRANRPFSLDGKLDDLDAYLPAGRSVCELRLLAVDPSERRGLILPGLMRMLAEHCQAAGYDLAIISGTTRQQKLYRRLGFVPFGPLVGSSDALFQPMYLTVEDALARSGALLERLDEERADRLDAPLNLLPGPVDIHADVQEAFGRPPVSHRAGVVVDRMARVRQALRDLTGAGEVYVMMGSGTLANDAVAARIALDGGRGLVLSNGEFGERLIDHAARAGLNFEPVPVAWGAPLPLDEIDERLAQDGPFDWLWAVHSETSTGVLNDLEGLKRLAGRHGVRLCLDGISSIGVLPVELSGVHLATAVSGKGLGSLPGLAMVFARSRCDPAPGRVPRYLDLGLYDRADGIPFTLSSNLLAALEAALARSEPEAALGALRDLSNWLRRKLEAAGAQVLAPPAHASPAVLTIVVPPEHSSVEIGRSLSEAGYLLSFESRYLVERNWLQICLMGGATRAQLEPLVAVVADALATEATAVAAPAP